MVFYRKYRPQTIHDLDSQEVRDKLYSVLSQPDVAHAFLFTGSKGLGKTSAARIVAKVVNCERLVSSKLASSSKNKKLNARSYTLDAKVEPCNQCDQCISITNGSNLDVLEIDGASNRGIDEIRDLREKIRLSPVLATKKVYIIDEVHMLTTEAFNALLKTLEEPPSHVLFILCTTEPHKIPATIVSRCFHIPFKTAAAEELKRSFLRIAKAEKLAIEEEALTYIAKLSGGGFRDGAKILEEMVLAAQGQPITREFVEKKYQISNIKYQISNMIESLAQKDTKKSLELIQNIVDQGVDLKYFMEQLIYLLHGLLLSNFGVEEEEEVRSKNYELGTTEIKRLIELLTQAYSELKYAVLPQLPLELAVIEWSFEGVAGRLPHDARDAYTVKDQDREKNASSAEKNIWQEFIEKVKQKNHSTAGVLRGCLLKEHTDSKVIIEAAFKFHKEKLQEKKTLGLLEQVWEEINGKKPQIRVELKVSD